MRYLPTAVAVLFVFPLCATVGFPADVDCHEDLERAVELIDRRWSFKLYKPGSVDFASVYAELEDEAKEAETPAECADVLRRFMSELGDGHSALRYYPELEHTRPDIEVRSQRERLTDVPGQRPPIHAYVFSRDSTDETLKAILPGSEILEVDGTPVEELYSYWEERVSGSTHQWIQYMCDEHLLLGPAGTEVELRIKEPTGRLKTVTVKRPPYPDEEEREEERRIWEDTVTVADSRILDGGWGYLRYTTFHFGTLDETVERFDRALDSIFDAPGLIIDLRGNGGGYVGAMTEIAGRFIDDDVTLGYFQVRQPGEADLADVWDPTTGSITSRPRLLAKPRDEIYRGPLVILTDRRCFSACEGFAGGLQSIGRALLVGSSRTGGGSGFVDGLELPSGAIISFSWTVAWRPDGRQVEGNGVGPDVPVRPRPRYWVIGRDLVLRRGIKALESGEAPALDQMVVTEN